MHRHARLAHRDVDRRERCLIVEHPELPLQLLHAELYLRELVLDAKRVADRRGPTHEAKQDAFLRFPVTKPRLKVDVLRRDVTPGQRLILDAADLPERVERGLELVGRDADREMAELGSDTLGRGVLDIAAEARSNVGGACECLIESAPPRHERQLRRLDHARPDQLRSGELDGSGP